MSRYRYNLYQGIVTNNEEPRTHGWRTGARILDILRGRSRVWNGTRFVRSEMYDLLTQEGHWDYDTGTKLFRTFVTYGGTVSGNFFLANSNRLATRFLTAAAANSPAGMRVPTLISRRSTEPVMVYSVQAGDVLNTKHFHGFASYTTQVPVGAGVTNPLGNTDSGFMIGFIQGGNFKIYHNDGGGAPPTPIDTGFAVAASTLYQFGIEIQDVGNKAIWQIINLNTNPPTFVGSGEVTTDLPPVATSLAPHFHAESTSASQINLYLPTARLYQRG